MSVRVTLDLTAPETHLVRVHQRFPATEEPRRVFRMAAWIPGSYKIYDLARHVQDMTASVAGAFATCKQVGKDAWAVSGCQNVDVELTFDVYCRSLSVDTSHVTSDHAHLLPVTLLLYDDDSRARPHQVRVRKPRRWQLWSGLETEALDGTLEVASNYDHLIDCPIEVGPPASYQVERFTLKRRVHRLIFWNPPKIDLQPIVQDVRSICEATCDLWKEVPYSHYTFITHLALDHGGGLEHRNSTTLGLDPFHLVDEKKRQTRFYPLVAHEYFHTWNVKQAKPSAFEPYDLQEESYTSLLWLFEGFTTYYELPILARAGVVDAKAWGKIAVEMLEYYELALGRNRISASGASRLTWTLLYKPHEQNINRNVSYYTKGLWIGLCIDAALRKEGVRDGLDSVMRHMWAERSGGIEEGALGRLVLDATGVDMRSKITRWTEGTSELPIASSLRTLGVDLQRGRKEEKDILHLGVHFKKGSSKIERIPDDRAAYRVLQPDDELVAIDGYRWSGSRFVALVRTRVEGDTIPITFWREGRLRTLDVPLSAKPKDKITMKPRKEPAAAKRRKAWLKAW